MKGIKAGLAGLTAVSFVQAAQAQDIPVVNKTGAKVSEAVIHECRDVARGEQARNSGFWKGTSRLGGFMPVGDGTYNCSIYGRKATLTKAPN